MRIAVHDFGAYPFTAQLARALAERGNEVVYLFASGIKQPRARVERHPGDPASITYTGVSAPGTYRRSAGPLRMLQERRYGAALAAAIVAATPDVVVSANCPLDAQAQALRASHAAGAGFVHWFQDVYSLAVGRLIGRRFPLAGRLLGARFARLERDVVRSSEHVVAITEDFVPLLHDWGVHDGRVTVIPNWTPLDEIEPRLKGNPWSEEHGLATRPVLLYAGTLGRKHDPRLLARLAGAVPEAIVAVVAEGTGVEPLRRLASRHRNLRLLPMQPVSHLADMFGSADVLVAILEPEAGKFSVPSKVLTYLAAGRAILAAIPATNAASRLIADAGAGIVVEPGDASGLLAAARALIDDRDLRSTLGRDGRAYALREFQIEAKADSFADVLSAAARAGLPPHATRLDTGNGV